MTLKKAEVILEYGPLLMDLPIPQDQMYRQTTTNDDVTIRAWSDTWLKQAKANKEKYGEFAQHSIGKFFGYCQNNPIIIVGSGPSLKKNAHVLLKNKNIPVISCLHNFHYLEDLGVHVDFYTSLDAGPVTISEVSEGGTKTPEEYWEMTRGKKLLCYVGTHPGLLEKWQGEVYFFNCPVPSQELELKMKEIEVFNTNVSSGGNVLGASFYIAKSYLGAATSIFIGADFSFSYDYKFHGWDSKYDASLGHTVFWTDIYGIRVKTWQSYLNFKLWFDLMSSRVPGEIINCTEGGIFGAYAEGNYFKILQMDLETCLERFSINEHIREQAFNPKTENRTILF